MLHLDLGNIRDLLNSALKPLGIEVARRGRSPSWNTLFEQLKHFGFWPKTVFDIGVAAGTPWLYEAFPDSLYYLIDPTNESRIHMEMIAKSLNAQILNVALGDKPGHVDIYMRDDIGASTFFTEVAEARLKAKYVVKMERLDSIVTSFETPSFCKIDVQGSEVMVLKGMSGIIDNIDVFVIEASLIATIIDGPEVLDIMNLMDQYGFCLYDILSFGRRPLDRALAQVDIAFVRKDSVFRQDKRWATSVH